MNKIILIAFAIIVIAAAAAAGLLSPQSTDRSVAFPPPSCIDFDPPDETKTVVLNGVQYDLVKENAWIPASKVRNEMEPTVGATPDGKNIYQVRGSRNKLGQRITFSDFAFVEIKREVRGRRGREGSYYFDIYIRHGIPIPDEVRNCRTKGGTVAVQLGDPTAFPPPAFNTTQVKGLTIELDAPGWLYMNDTENVSDLQTFPGVQVNIGSLPTTKGDLPLAFHSGTLYLIDGSVAYVYDVTEQLQDLQNDGKKSLQLKEFKFVTAQNYSWWTPTCKPAIYLYPTEKTDVNVKVQPQGFLTLTIPDYPKEGWKGTAYPSGLIEVGGKQYPYLYYESKIRDDAFVAPSKGYVVAFEDLPSFYPGLLSKLGLSDEHIDDFVDYWKKALPKSPYYFVGVVEPSVTDSIEPLIISPKPDTVIRARLYFEALSEKRNVEAPSLITPVQKGFTVVEWGGMVKTDKEHPFTCSQ